MRKRTFVFLVPFAAVGAIGMLYVLLSWALNAGPSVRYAVGAAAIATMISIWWWAAGELTSFDRRPDTARDGKSGEAGDSGSLEPPRADVRTA